jgi:hypothetical protein
MGVIVLDERGSENELRESNLESLRPEGRPIPELVPLLVRRLEAEAGAISGHGT